MPLIKDVPIWASHSIDDPTVGYTAGTLALMNALDAAGALTTRGQWAGNLADRTAEAEALRLWAQADANQSHTLLTAYTAGHDSRERALVLGPDLLERRDARLALRAGPSGSHPDLGRRLAERSPLITRPPARPKRASR